ncbi:MAG: glycosyltransferase, partial [Deltaproteobacteria bacterium]|nr:glycosyltransferase [Deltaproteobacteria bacterium]
LGALRLPYAVWYVDSPTFIIKDFRRNISSYCALFVWDRSYLERMRQFGFDHACYLPLATDPSVFRPIVPSAVPARFRGAVSFVGNSMKEAVDEWSRRFPHSERTEAVSRLAVAFQISHPHVSMETILETVGREQGLRVEFEDPVHYLNFQASLVWRATLEFRKRLVESLETLGIRIFGDRGWRQILDGKVKISPPVSYYRDLPLVFNGTEVNINATSFQMNSAVNQRVFDAASCGAFLVTDYRPDMDILFDRKREAVCYGDPAEARDQVAYYLKHEGERMKIAERARQRILEEHTYCHRIRELIDVMREKFGSF